jgi:S-formylglutathione hydrolase FrmB
MKARRFHLLVGILLAVGCQALPSTSLVVDQTPPAFACDEPGTIVRSEIESAGRGYAYNFHVYLPPCYESEAERRYPIVYLIPGRGSGPGAWFTAGADHAAEALIRNGDVPPFIIVTTENTDSDPYADAIFNDLIPDVESRYRIEADRNHRAAAGGSLGGIGAYRLAFRHPDQFASAGIFGSGLISGEEAQFKAWLGAIPAEAGFRVFFNCGEGDPLMLERTLAMISLLDEAGIQSTLIRSEGGHDYGYWVSNLPAYFRWLAQDW